MTTACLVALSIGFIIGAIAGWFAREHDSATREIEVYKDGIRVGRRQVIEDQKRFKESNDVR